MIKKDEFIKVFLVDDQELVRAGLKRLLTQKDKNIFVVGEAENIKQALELIPEAMPDVILLDINLPDGSGIDATREILKSNKNCHVILLTIYNNEEFVIEGIKAGAEGYLIKDISSDKLIESIKKIYSGESLIDDSLAAKIIKNFTNKPKDFDKKQKLNRTKNLTNREYEILKEITSGLSNKEIADKLFLSERTVKNHITHIFQKIDVHDRTQAAISAIKEGVIDLEEL